MPKRDSINDHEAKYGVVHKEPIWISKGTPQSSWQATNTKLLLYKSQKFYLMPLKNLQVITDDTVLTKIEVGGNTQLSWWNETITVSRFLAGWKKYRPWTHCSLMILKCEELNTTLIMIFNWLLIFHMGTKYNYRNLTIYLNCLEATKTKKYIHHHKSCSMKSLQQRYSVWFHKALK